MANTYYIDIKYAKLLGARLPNFKQPKAHTWIFSHSCEQPKPGKRAKTRGYFFTYKNALIFKCHHCGASSSFGSFLKNEDPVLYDEYRLEVYKSRVESGVAFQRLPEHKEPPKDIQTVLESVPRDEVLSGLKSLSELPHTHPAVKYAIKRAIPKEHFDRIFFCPKIYKFASKYKEHLADIDPKLDHPRLIFPYFDSNDRVYAYTARAFGNETPKYMFIKTDENTSNIYGLWRLDTSKKILAVEGQIDSLCLDNTIAVGGADYSNPILKQLQSNLIIVPDNDFERNAQVANQIDKAIKMGYTISLFPEGFRHKDINDAIRSGINSAELRDMIISNAKSGLEAKLELIYRRKR